MKIRTKLLSILCAVAMLVAMGAVASPLPGVSAEAGYTQNFEDLPALGAHYARKDTAVDLSVEQAFSGSASAKFTIKDYTSSAKNTRVVYADATGPVLFAVGSEYTATMKVYAATSFDAKIRVITDANIEEFDTSTGSRAGEEPVSLVGGLTIGTVLTLLVIPVVYTMFDNKAEKRKQKKLAKLKKAE